MSLPKVAPHVLVVEDEPDLREAIVSYLNRKSMIADGVGSIRSAETWLATHPVDVLICDLGLPDGDGLAWIQGESRIAQKGLIILTARGQVTQRIAGLKSGADVYLVKPVTLEELALYVSNLYQKLKATSVLNTKWHVNSKTWMLTAPNAKSIKLNDSEKRFLLTLQNTAGEVVRKNEIILALGGNPDIYDFRRIETLLRRLRAKCLDETGLELPVQTVYGHGFAFIDII